MHESPLAERVVREFSRVSGDRGNWESHWEEIAERFFPSHAGAFSSPGSRSQGEKRTDKILDSTAPIALNRFGSILDSLLTPRNQKWHRLRASVPELNEDQDVRVWFDAVTDILFQHRYAPRANFASQNQQQYISLGAYGTGCMFLDELPEGGIRYRNIHLSEVYFLENHQGLIDTAFRKFSLTARQAQQKWGKPGANGGSKTHGLPEKILEAVKEKPDTKFEFLHVVKPRDEVDVSKADFRSMPFASLYVALDCKHLVSEGGYSSFPYAISRWTQAPCEVYGRSPAMDVLPAVKTLNEQKRTLLKAGHRTVDPVLLAHDDGVLSGFSLRPGDINYGGVNADGRPLVHTLPIGRVDIGLDLMDAERLAINDAFLVTLFQILIETPTMTATEVLERTREKGILLAPTVGRQADEYLGPMIERELNILARLGVLPEMPPLLAEAAGEYKIEFDSPLSRAQRAEEAAGFMRTVDKAIEIAGVTQDMSILDNFDLDAAMREIADIQGVPARWLKSEKLMAQLREARAEQNQQMTDIQAAPGKAALIKAGVAAQEARRAA